MRITDWDDAYANRDHIPEADGYIERWPAEAQVFRDRLAGVGRAELDVAYGTGARNQMDVFHPEGRAEGLVVFVHGGYWRAFDRRVWSQLAEGCVTAGWAVAMPSYTLAPEIPISGITAEIALAIGVAAERVQGPIRLVGHSAGGHLVTRMVCEDTALTPDALHRIRHVVSISGVHDLRPLIRTAMNADFHLDAASAAAESPALHVPLDAMRVTVWVGADERPEFVRQSALLANVWIGLGADMALEVEAGRHHFDVVDGLRDPDAPLTRRLLS